MPLAYAIRGLYGVTISQQHQEVTAGPLVDLLGFRAVANDGNRFRYVTGAGGAGAIVDVLHMPGTLPGTMGAGAVHHVAWRTPNETQQVVWRRLIEKADVSVTSSRNRLYFESVYFREPGGVLFEIATDGPGFTIDEPVGRLGSRLQLPPWLEPLRWELEHGLPSVYLVGERERSEQVSRQGQQHGIADQYF